MNTRTLSQEQIIAEAADWFARLREPEVPPSAHDEFTSWLLRSPAHIEEYLAVTRRWNDVGAASGEDMSVAALVRAARAEPAPENVVALKRPGSGTEWEKLQDSGALDPNANLVTNPFRRPSARIAAVLALFAIALTTWILTGPLRHPSHIATAIGEQRSLTLDDGSILYLNTDSDARIDLTSLERRVVLARGEARFTVAKDPQRPFLVSTPQATVKAVGTVFNVRAASSGTSVTVLEGRVAILSPSPPSGGEGRGEGFSSTFLQAGEHASVTREGKVLPNTGLSVERALAWPERRLVFREDSLADVVAEYNRYLAQPLRIEDPALGALRISGTFNAGEPRSLIQYLERYEKVEMQTATDGARQLKLIAP